LILHCHLRVYHISQHNEQVTFFQKAGSFRLHDNERADARSSTSVWRY